MTYRSKVTTEKIILAINLVVYRIDALLTNIIDGAFILSYRVIMGLILEQQSHELLSIVSLIIFLPILLHIIYVIVYVINDLIDYSNPHGLKMHLDSSFYRLRPIYYFQRSRLIVVYIILLYVAYVTLILTFIRSLYYLSIFFIALTILLSIAHSLHGATVRVVTFYLLRLMKYVYMVILFDVLVFNQIYDHIITMVILTLVLPYTIYSTVNYGKLVSLRDGTVQIMLILVISIIISLIIFFKVAPVKHQLIDIMKASITSYLLIVLPIFGIRQVLRKIFGVANPTYYYHLLRLILGIALTLLTIISLFYMLTLIML
ncbi:MAG: hypothetical protein QXY55_05710 [Candidatus Korarchaeota archaeon]